MKFLNTGKIIQNNQVKLKSRNKHAPAKKSNTETANHMKLGSTGGSDFQ